jgi:hypothetical protein
MKASGMENAAVASHCRACGKVARELLEASARPTSAETDITTPVEVLKTAWHTASKAIFRFILSGGLGLVIDAPDVDLPSDPFRQFGLSLNVA